MKKYNVTIKMCDMFLNNNMPYFIARQHNMETFKIPAEIFESNNYEPFSIIIINISELMPVRYKNANKGLYKSNNQIEVYEHDILNGTVKIHESDADKNYNTVFSINHHSGEYDEIVKL